MARSRSRKLADLLSSSDEKVGASALAVTGNGTAGQVLQSDGDGSFSWGEIDSSSLSVAMDVNANGSVTQNTVVNFSNADGTIGVNPVPNGLTATDIDPNHSFDAFNSDGSLMVRAFFSSGIKIYVGVKQADGSFVFGSQISLSTYSNPTGINQCINLSGNTFFIGTSYGNNGATAYGEGCWFRLSSSGTVEAQANHTSSYKRTYYERLFYSAVNIEGSTNQAILSIDKADVPYGEYDRRYYVLTYGTNGSFGLSEIPRSSNSYSVFAGTSQEDHKFKFYKVSSGSKVFIPKSNRNDVKLFDWNGSVLSNETSVTAISDLGDDSVYYYRPSSTVDHFIVAYKDTANQLLLRALEWDGSGFNTLDTQIIEQNGVSGNIGSIRGSGNTFAVGWTVNSKGYVNTFTWDSVNRTFNGSGMKIVHNYANERPILSNPNTSDEYTVAYNDTDNLVHSNIFTANTYNTVDLNLKGISTQTVSGGSKANVIVRGIVSGMSGLTQGAVYYYNTLTYDGTLTTTETTQRVGTAISDTELLIDGL